MAERRPVKASHSRKAPAAKAVASKGQRTATNASQNTLQSAVERLEATIVELRGERERLSAELASARKQIALLDAIRLDAINRIDWAIDSLQTTIQK